MEVMIEYGTDECDAILRAIAPEEREGFRNALDCGLASGIMVISQDSV